ncbi:MAG: flippase-like domain-containing protein [Acidobacteriota bacterium]|nr:MAG: flippase-like domain-containing protein [Acidobacteriota bacterium]
MNNYARPARYLVVISGLLGCVLFVYVIYRTGIGEIRSRIADLGAGFLLILLLSFLRHLVRAFSWQRCMPPESRGTGLWSLLRARLAGEAIGDLTFGPVVAEPMRLLVLSDKLSFGHGLSSLAVENIAYAFSSALMVVAGAVAVLARFGLRESTRLAIILALGLTACIAAASFLAIARRLHLGSQALSRLGRILIRDRDRLDDKMRKLRNLEDYVFDFYARRPVDLAIVGLCQVCFHFAGVVEIYATLKLIGADLNLASAFLLESINRTINIAFTFVPGLVGVDEAGTAIMTAGLGFGAASGVALAIIRKIRMFFWIAVGLLVMLPGRK